jgi:hypothetical protein
VNAKTESSARIAASHCASSILRSLLAAPRQASRLGDFGVREQPLLFGGQRQRTFEHFDAAAFATSATAAGKFHALREQHVLQRRAARDGQRLTKRQQFDPYGSGHGGISVNQ